MDQDEIKKALDFFEDDEFVQSKEILQAEIKKKKDEYFKDKLGLKNAEPEYAEPEEDPNWED